TGQFDPDNRIKTDLLTLEELNTTRPNGLVDLAGINSYGFDNAQTTMERTSTDFAYLWSSSSNANFIAMNNTGFSGWASINNIVTTWSTAERNPGTFVQLSNPTAAEILTAARITNRAQLIDAYNQAEADVASRPGYNAT